MDQIPTFTWLDQWLSDGIARDVRRGSGLSIYDIARLVDATPSSVSRWENRVTRPLGRNRRAYGTVLRQLAEQAGLTDPVLEEA